MRLPDMPASPPPKPAIHAPRARPDGHVAGFGADTADAAPPEDHVRAADRPQAVTFRAVLWLIVAAMALALPFAIILADDPPGAAPFSRNLAYALGFAGLALVALQFALTGRLRPLVEPFGADIVPVFHRYLSWAAVALILGHFGMLYVWYQDDLGSLSPLTAAPHMTAGRVGLAAFLLLIITSEFRKRLRLDYLWWRWMHVCLALVGFGAAVWHVLGASYFTAGTGTRAMWLAVTLAWLGLIVHIRVIRPLQQRRNPWRVIENRDEGGGVRSLVLRPEGRPLHAWRPGQFAWLAIGSSPFSLREHPFTISTAPDRGPEITFSIKPLGDDSERLSEAQPGKRAWIDGPYGVFTVDREADAPGFVMIAGGVGITPILANLHALHARRDPRPIHLLYGNPEWDDIAFRDELADMAQTIDLRVTHVLETPPDKSEDAKGATIVEGRIDAELLERVLPRDSRDWPHMLCGPAPMLDALREGLRDRGTPLHRIHSEIFEMV